MCIRDSPKAGYVEHDPMEIYSSQYGVMVEVLAKSNVQPEEIAAIGITKMCIRDRY